MNKRPPRRGTHARDVSTLNIFRLPDERGGRSVFGVPIGAALEEVYELEHDDERVYDGSGEGGHINFPE